MIEFKPISNMDKHYQIMMNTDCVLLEEFKLKELLIRAKNGDKAAVEEICKMFNGMIVNLARSFYINGYTLEDMIQEGRVSLIKAVQKYDIDSKYPFTAYAFSAVEKNFYYEIRSNSKKLSCCSLYSVNKNGTEVIEMIASEENMEEDLIKKQQSINIWKSVGKLLKEERNIIIWCYVRRRSLKEYSIRRKISYRAVLYKKKKALEHLKSIICKDSWCPLANCE